MRKSLYNREKWMTATISRVDMAKEASSKEGEKEWGKKASGEDRDAECG